MPRKVSVCPPGVWCLTPTLGFILCIGVAVVLYCIVHSIPANIKEKQDIHVYNTVASSEAQGGDDRYSRAPEPLRVWQTGPDLRGGMLPPGAIPINVTTRGLPQSFQQMGIVKSDGQVLPLYGRQTAYRSDRYNYYTRTDTYNPVQLPIRYERKDCMDSIGCGELLGGETIKIAGIGKDANVEIYKFDGPTYIPGIV